MHVRVYVCVQCMYVIGLTYVGYYNNDDGIKGKCKSVDLLKFLSFSLSLSVFLCLSFLLCSRMEWSGGI